ncbi:MAG: diacylglycerol kinase family lipid kinase [Anaerolineaceae bacterium]|nr:diacylglycerol kinase family lipid kinase [Anaerolineaceae bacterium]
MAKYMVILNPVSGFGTGEKSYPRIVKALDSVGLDYDLVRSGHRGHIIELARDAALGGYDVVVAAGGDGTVNEAINGLMAAKEAGVGGCALGVLCVGRGNDFAYGVDIPPDLEDAARVLAAGHRRTIDIGRVTGGLFPDGRYFGNCVGVGFDAIGTIEVAKLPRLGGFLSHFIAVLKTIFLYYKAPLSTIKFSDQVITQPSLLVSIMNGQRLGGGFMMAPDGKPDDGLFDLCIVHEVSRARIFRLIPHFLRGTQATQEPIRTGQAKHITIPAEEGTLPAQTDGEILCVDGQQLMVEILPLAMDVICSSPEGG